MFRDDYSGCNPRGIVPMLNGQATTHPNQHRLDSLLSNGLPNGFAMLAFGARAIRARPIPPSSGCSLLAEPTACVARTTHATGSADFRFDLLRPFPPATLDPQALPFDFTPRAFSSDRLDMILVPSARAAARRRRPRRDGSLELRAWAATQS